MEEIKINIIDKIDKINKETIINTTYTLSHLIFSVILVICIKKYSKLLLTFLLSLILIFISYSEKDVIPSYVLILIGTLIYLIDKFIINKNDVNKIDDINDIDVNNNVNNNVNNDVNNDLDKYVEQNLDKYLNEDISQNYKKINDSIGSDVWKIPFWSIISYYIIIFGMYIKI